MSSAPSDDSTMSWTSVSIRFEPVSPRIAISSCGRSSSESSPYRTASSMSWLMYATRSTSRTIFPSSVSGSRSPVCVRIPSQTSCGEVERPRDAERLLVVAETPAEPLGHGSVERVLARMPERRVAHVVPEPDRLDEILVQPERPRDDARDRRRLERVGHPRAVVVALGVDEDLRLPLQPPERLRVDDAVAIALELRADLAWLLGKLAPARLEGAHRVRRQLLLARSDDLLERHAVSVEARGAGQLPPRTTQRMRGRPCRSRPARAQRHPRLRRRSIRSGSRPHARR